MYMSCNLPLGRKPWKCFTCQFAKFSLVGKWQFTTRPYTMQHSVKYEMKFCTTQLTGNRDHELQSQNNLPTLVLNIHMYATRPDYWYVLHINVTDQYIRA